MDCTPVAFGQAFGVEGARPSSGGEGRCPNPYFRHPTILPRSMVKCADGELWGRFPHSDNPGGLNGSLQHLLEVLLQESRRLISFAGINSNKTKALVRF
jgi:hypothetical protein